MKIINQTFPTLLKSIAANPSAELEWLDMLSQLEFVGCRKIIKSQGFDRMNASILRHLSEEASHAYLLRAVVEQIDPQRGPWTCGTLAEIGWKYFQTLDAQVASALQVRNPYPAVSWAIERRVLWVYPMYLEITSRDDVRRAVRQILAQEKRHAAQFDSADITEDQKRQCIGIEEPLWNALERELSESLCS